VAVGDFNGDGKADLVVASNYGTNVNVLWASAMAPLVLPLLLRRVERNPAW